jgi:hypothetical protein
MYGDKCKPATIQIVTRNDVEERLKMGDSVSITIQNDLLEGTTATIETINKGDN